MPSDSTGWRRVRWWIIGAGLGAGAVLLGVFLGSRPAPARQPIRFSHQLHVKQAKCAACHQYTIKLAAAGTPRLADCLDCHEGSQAKTPDDQKEEAKIEEFAKTQREIPWVRIAALAPDVFFSHRRHVSLGKVECATCHGAIADTTALPSKPAVAFTMTWCLSCHQERKASVDCLACHR